MAGRPRDGDSLLFAAHQKAKKDFARELRKVSRSYENEQVMQTVRSAEINRNEFWKIVKRSQNSHGGEISAIRVSEDIVVHDASEILLAFKGHFERVCIPKSELSYDNKHFKHISNRIKKLNLLKDIDRFLEQEFTLAEVQTASNKLHLKNASGYDNVNTEHIRYAGTALVQELTTLYNLIIKLEYIPVNFRRKIQVPLYKGKNLCILDIYNYRGITLLTNFNRIFEILMWNMLEKWWVDNSTISNIQGACRKAQSCIHTAFLLQETVSSALEHHRSVFVAFYDVSKAFNTVWTDGLFSKLYDIGITGKIWHLL